jgi:Flp pilus assembly protein TadD
MADINALYDEAHNLKEQGDLEGAVAKLREALAVDDTHALTHSALAVSLQRLGQYDDAIQHATRVTQLEPNDPFSYTQLSVICQRCGKIQEAEDAMAKSREVQMRGHA